MGSDEVRVNNLTNSSISTQDNEQVEVQNVDLATRKSIASPINLNDFVGEHGGYQLAITMLLFVRYVLLGLMANSGPLMTPDVTFYCHLPMDEVLSIMPNISTLSPQEQELEIKEEFKQICQIDLHLYQNNSQLVNLTNTKSQLKTTPLIVTAGQQQVMTTTNLTNSNLARIRECTDFTYQLAPDQGLTMTNDFDLVCDRDWLRSLFQSLLSASIVIAHVFWGTFSDKFGRFKAQKICLVISLLAGLLSIFAPDFWTFTLTRALCSFGDLGMVVSLTTTVVELVGSRYRGLSVALVNFGFALGVSLLPYVVAYFENYRVVVTFTIVCHAITMPMVLATNESVRWLMTNRKFKQARKELRRISRYNRWWREMINLFRFKTKTDTNLVSEKELTRRLSKTAKRLEKETFDLLFREFVRQVETLNICDPCAKVEQSIKEEAKAIQSKTIRENYRENRDLPLNNADELSNQSISRRNSIDNITKLYKEAKEEDNQLDRPHLFDVRMKTLSLSARCAESSSECSIKQDEFHIQVPSKQQPDCINLVAHQLSFVGRVNRLFKDKKLMICVFTIVWTTFNSELLYTSFIIINLEVGEDLYLNYILGGCMEALAAIMASLLLSYAPRRVSLIAFWLLISFSCFGLSLAHIDSHWAVWMLALAKFSQSSLSSIASVAAYESFPTFLRQSGSGLVFTLGMLGSVFAPLIFAEFDDHAGMDRVLMTFSFSSLTAAVLIYLYLNETRDCELQ